MNIKPNVDQKKIENIAMGTGDEICIVRFDCNLETLSKLFDAVQFLERKRDNSVSLFSIKYFRYNGDSLYINTFYNEKPENLFEFKKDYVINSAKEDFFKAAIDKKLILWEPCFMSDEKEDTDVAYFQYFLLVLKYMEKKGYRYNVRISGGKSDKKEKYIPIDYGGKWSRLRTFLYLYSPEELSKIYIYGNYNSNKQWQRLKAEEKQGDLLEFGKIFPLLSITEDTYKALVQTTCGQHKEGAWGKKLNDLYYSYIERYLIEKCTLYGEKVKELRKIKTAVEKLYKKEYEAQAELNDIINMGLGAKDETERGSYIKPYRDKFAECKKIKEELIKLNQDEQNLKEEREILRGNLIKALGLKDFENDSLLEGLIFISTLTYLEDDDLTNIAKRKDLTRLHEICVDYAQGIAQLIENIIFHVVCNSETGEYDSGCGSFTFRIRKKKEAKYYIAEGDGKECNFAYFMELYVADFNYGEFDGLVSKFLDNVKNRGGKWATTLTKGEVKLPHLFGEDLERTKMEEYYKDVNNIAMHYGLQILNSVVVTGEGGLYVVSGYSSDTEPNATNSFYNEYKKNSYSRPNFLWRNGTAYIIYLPIKYEEAVNYGDVIAVSNLECKESKKDGMQLFVSPTSWETIALTSVDKEKAVTAVKKELSKQIKGKKVFYINLSCIISNNIYAYEVLAKAIFMLLHGEKLKDIALINIPNENDVIKIFRQIALFYNRFGENSMMEDKSVYLIDSSGVLDLLLYGSKIDSIKENLVYGKIYGGYSDEAMEIINHLCGRAKGEQNERKN